MYFDKKVYKICEELGRLESIDYVISELVNYPGYLEFNSITLTAKIGELMGLRRYKFEIREGFFEHRWLFKKEGGFIKDLGLTISELDETNLSINEGHITRFFLRDRLIDKIPKSIKHLRYLRDLSVISGEVTKVSKRVKHLTQLKYFDLSDNFLGKLPDLPVSIEELYLYDNILKEVPDSIWSLKNLKILGLTDNRISDLPSRKVLGLEKLEQLSLDDPEKYFSNKTISKLIAKGVIIS